MRLKWVDLVLKILSKPHPKGQRRRLDNNLENVHLRVLNWQNYYDTVVDTMYIYLMMVSKLTPDPKHT